MCEKILLRRLRMLSWISCSSILAKSWTVSGPSIIQNLMKNTTSAYMNQLLISTKILSLSLSHILPSGVFVSRIGVDGRSKRRRRRRRGRRVGIGGGSGSPWSGVELRLYMRKPTASPVMDTVRTRRVYRIRHRQCSDHTLSLSLSLCVQFNFGSGVQEWSGVEFLKLRLPFVLQLQSVQLLTSHWLNIIIIIILMEKYIYLSIYGG